MRDGARRLRHLQVLLQELVPVGLRAELALYVPLPHLVGPGDTNLRGVEAGAGVDLRVVHIGNCFG